MQRAILETLFEDAGCVRHDTAVLQPADPFLNAAGEAFRKSLFVTSRADGETLCLRPEFTIPVCLQHGQSVARYYYQGTVFRQRVLAGDDRPQEFDQAGVEAFGERDFARADADMVHLALKAVNSYPHIDPVVQIGDPAFFNALVAPIGLPEIWRERLTRAFGDTVLVERILQRMISPGATGDQAVDPRFKTALDAADSAALGEEIAEQMAEQGVLDAGGRTPEDIAARLLKKRTEQMAVPLKVAETCQSFSALQCAARDVADTFMQFGKAHNIDFDKAIAAFKTRMDAGLSDVGVSIDFAANFGRRLDYYTGFVFEIYDANDRAKGPVGGGGRYDRLSEMLGGKPQPAVGFSLWLDRLNAGRG